MLNIAAFFALMTLQFVVCFWFTLQRRWREGMWITWLLTVLCLPIWLDFRVSGGIVLEFPLMAGVAILLTYLMSPVKLVRLPFTFSDFATIMVPVAESLSNYYNDQITPWLIPSTFYSWLIPYYIGRNFLGGPEDIAKVGKLVGLICLINAGFAVVESITKVNFLGKLLGFYAPIEGDRYGLARARVCFGHPIIFGQVMMLTLPWCIEASRKKNGKISKIPIYPLASLVAIVASLTRGAILNYFECIYMAIFAGAKHRALMGVALALMAALLIFGEDSAISAIAWMAGEDETGNPIFINGEPYIYNSARHRLLQYKVFAEGLDNAGAFGMGPNLAPLMARSKVALVFSRSIDSHYILSTLRFGYVYLFSFHLMSACMVYRFGKIAWRRTGPYAGLAATMFGASFVGTLTWLSVHLSIQISVVYIFYAGLACNIDALDRKWRRESKLAEAQQIEPV